MTSPSDHPQHEALAPPIGVIAGGGTLPGLVAQGIRAAGRSVAGIGLRGNVEPEFAALCDRFATVGVVRLGQWVRVARRFGVREAIMVGRVSVEALGAAAIGNTWIVVTVVSKSSTSTR